MGVLEIHRLAWSMCSFTNSICALGLCSSCKLRIQVSGLEQRGCLMFLELLAWAENHCSTPRKIENG